jgi:RNA polymerase sigma factor FliA
VSLAVVGPLFSNPLLIGGTLRDTGNQTPAEECMATPRPAFPGTMEKPDRQGMVLLHLPQVRLVAKSIWDRMRFAVELDDLIGYGTTGLVRAVERFDPSRGILLKTYAEHRIRGAILDGLRGMDWLPRSARQKQRQAQQASDLEPPANHCTQARAALLPHRERQHRATNGPPTSSAAYVPRMEAVIPGGNLGDLERLALASMSRHSRRSIEPDPESLYQQKEGYDKLAEAILQLPRRHREVIELYYRRELSMKQIGEKLHVHESRVSQLHAAALQKLRSQLKCAEAPVTPPAKLPPGRYRLVSNRRNTACQSSSVSTPMVSCAVSAT